MHTVLITGATGFLGKALANAFETDGWKVIRCGRRPPAGEADRWRRFDLAETSVPADFFSNVDVLVHAAYVRVFDDPEGSAMNVNGSKRLFDAARAANTHIVFVSSLAAHPAARSHYGREKLTIEGLLDPTRDLAVCPGLIIGEGGVFGRLLQHVRTGQPIPLIDGGRQPLQTVHRDDLVAAMRSLIQNRKAGRFILAETPAIPYRSFFQALVAGLGTRNLLIAVPSWLLLATVRLARLLHARSPIDADNVYGLMEMRFADPAANPAADLPRLRSATESLADVLGSSGAGAIR